MAWLTLLLFLPWFAVLGGLFWAFPRQPRTPRRRLVDAALLFVALAVSIAAMLWGYDSGQQTPWAGAIWRQVVAVLYAYGAFLGVMVAALSLRRRLWGFIAPSS